MEVLHAHCAGLDLHKDSVVACVRHMVDGKVTTEVRTFRTTTQELMSLSDWLSAGGVTHIAIAYASYWCNMYGTPGPTAPVTILIDERADGVRLSYDRMASLLATTKAPKP